MATIDIYPELTSGYIVSTDFADTNTYAVARDGTGTVSTYTGQAFGNVGQRYDGVARYTCYQLFHSWDTGNEIPAGAVILSAKFVVKILTDYSDTDFTYQIRENTNWPPTLTDSDWVAPTIGGTVLASMATVARSTDTDYELPVSSANFSKINRSGNTTAMSVSSLNVAQIAPTGAEYLYMYSEAGNYPILRIEYSTASLNAAMFGANF